MHGGGEKGGMGLGNLTGCKCVWRESERQTDRHTDKDKFTACKLT